jgi:hypothetical protein
MTYTEEDVQTDVDWLEGKGLDSDEAEKWLRSVVKNSGGKVSK